MLLDMLDTDVWCYTVSEGITTLLMYGLSKPWTCDCPASVSGILGLQLCAGTSGSSRFRLLTF